MTSNERAGTRILGSLRSADGKGVVRMEDSYDTDIDNLWSAFTDPRRLASWMGEVAGNLRLGGEFRARFFASGWEGTGRVEACEPPQRLLPVTEDPDEPYELVVEVTLIADGDQTMLAVGRAPPFPSRPGGQRRLGTARRRRARETTRSRQLFLSPAEGRASSEGHAVPDLP
jgi:uncharacterized protein YndB with AHSA1/START domain